MTKQKIVKPSELELDAREVDEIELYWNTLSTYSDANDLDWHKLGSFVSLTNRTMHYLRRDLDHLHAVVEALMEITGVKVEGIK